MKEQALCHRRASGAFLRNYNNLADEAGGAPGRPKYIFLIRSPRRQNDLRFQIKVS